MEPKYDIKLRWYMNKIFDKLIIIITNSDIVQCNCKLFSRSKFMSISPKENELLQEPLERNPDGEKCQPIRSKATVYRTVTKK